MAHDEPEHVRAVPPRRSLTVAGAAVIAVLGAITIPLILGGDDTTTTAATADHDIGPTPDGSDTTETATTTTTGPEGGPGGLVVTPSTGLHAGDRVELRAVPPGSGTRIVAQCAREVVGRNLTGTEPLSWCGGVSYSNSGPFPLSRVVPTASGRVDCAEEARRCVLAVRFGGPGGTDNRWAPLSFAPAGPIPEPEVRVKGRTDEATIADGGEVQLKISGFTPGSSVRVSQCRALEPLGYGIRAKGPGSPPAPEGCDGSPMRNQPVTVGPDGTLTTARAVWAEIFTSVGWVRCEPCEFRVTGTGPGIGTTATVALSLEETADPRRPEVEIVTPGPHRPGQTVEVQGSGFRHSGSLSLYVCPISKEGAIRRAEACHTPPTQSLPVKENGAIAGEIRLPGAEHALARACTAEPGVCGFGPPGTPPHPFFVPFDISG